MSEAELILIKVPDNTFSVFHGTDETTELKFDLTGATAGKKVTITSQHTDDISLKLPNRTGTFETVESDSAVLIGDTLDYSESELLTKTLISNKTLVITNPVQGKVVVLELTPAGFVLNLPAECIVISGKYKTTTVNYIYFHCVKQSPAKYLVTIGQQLA
jgi:hypothetical protein